MPLTKKSQAKRARFRQAAYICFRENGYHATTIDDICDAAESSKGSFYWHYESKVDVFIDILDTWAREVVEELFEQFEQAMLESEPIQAIERAFEREFHRARAIVPLWAEFTLHARRDREIQGSLVKFYQRARNAIADLLEQKSRGRLGKAAIQGAAAVILGAYMGLTLQDLADPQAQAELWVGQFMPVLGLMLQTLDDFGLPEEPTPESTPGQRVGADKLEAFFADEGVAAPIKTILEAARAQVLSIYPAADEKIIGGWHVVAYTNAGLVCHLKPRHDDVEITFYKGASLEDPHGLLEGGAKRRRSVFLTGDTWPQGLEALVRQAFEQE